MNIDAYIEEQDFIQQIANFVSDDPSRMQKVIGAVQYGVDAAIKRETEYAIDMETVAAQVLYPALFKQNKSLVLSKLEKHNGKNCRFKWDDCIEKLKQLIKKPEITDLQQEAK